MSRNDHPADRHRRRSVLGVGTAASAAFAAALISMGTAPIASADDDPFFDLFGSSGVNSWTTAADGMLPTNLASSLDASVESFQTLVTTADDPPDPFTDLTLQFDPSAFTVDPDHDTGGVPVTFIGDLAVGMDWLLSSSGLAASIDGLFDTLFAPNGLP